MLEYTIKERKPTADELCRLRDAVGWRKRDTADLQLGLDGSLFGVCAELAGEVIGTARVVGDGRSVFYVQDVIVTPGHQGRGIGKAMMEKVMGFIASHACTGAVVGLMAAKGREPFYEKFGFASRPDDRYGAGMTQFWSEIH
jgi:GNAT superfamily N-acetyltransferase